MDTAALILDIATVRVLPSLSATSIPRHQALLCVYMPVAEGVEFKLVSAGKLCAYVDLEASIRQLKAQYPSIKQVRRQDLGQMSLMRIKEHLAHPMRLADIF